MEFFTLFIWYKKLKHLSFRISLLKIDIHIQLMKSQLVVTILYCTRIRIILKMEQMTDMVDTCGFVVTKIFNLIMGSESQNNNNGGHLKHGVVRSDKKEIFDQVM